MSQFIKDIRQGMTNLVVCGFTNDIGDGLLAELIVHKLPDPMATFKELMYFKHPLQTATVLIALDEHQTDKEENSKSEPVALSSLRIFPALF